MGQIANLVRALGVAALVPAYLMLVVLGVELAGAAGPGEGGAGLGLVGLAAVDVAVVYGIASTSRLRRGPLYALLAAVVLGTKLLGTGLLVAWIPAALVLPALVLMLMGRRSEPSRPWRAPVRVPAERLLEVVLLAVVVLLLRLDPLVAALGVVVAVPVLRTTAGAWWVGGLWVALLLAFVAHDGLGGGRSLEGPLTGLMFGAAVAWLVGRPATPASLLPRAA